MVKAETTRTRKYRKPTLYDAVAGRVTSQGFVQGAVSTKQRSEAIVPPEEVLYRGKDAPVRYEEDDVYFQNRHLTAEQRLPDSDLLKIIHVYAADFYARTSEDKGKVDQKSLDETALIALGILLEEAAVKIMDKTGQLALLEES